MRSTRPLQLAVVFAFTIAAAGAPRSVDAAAPPTAAEAAAFVAEAESKLLKTAVDRDRAQWVNQTYITEDSEALAAQGDERYIAATVDLAKRAARFKDLKLPDDVARKLLLLRLSLPLAAPADPAESEEVTRIVTSMQGRYAKGKVCPGGGSDPAKPCLTLEEVGERMAASRDPAELLSLWLGWHAVSPPMRPEYARFVSLANKGARELGFADTGAMWRSRYDMPPEELAREVDRLWAQVRPLYESLHAYVRWKLRERYGDVVPASGPIPAHLLGNMWAQSWGNVFPLIAPKEADPGFDLTAILKARNPEPKEMVRFGERFFTSIGFAPLPETFWTRSLFTRPRDREVVCHASAWDVDQVYDLRIKMCILPNEEDFVTIHHELGHNFYQRAYSKQPFLLRDSAHDGFHEAIGDTIALSITPAYLVKIGFLDKEPPASKDIGLLLRLALDRVAFLPFGLLVDQWRWKVFSGEVPPERYNAAWWELRRKYQGVSEPAPRTEKDFDPGAKHHVASNTPYSRYFFAQILQFQLHKALAEAAGCRDSLNRCSIYGNREAGRRLNEMLEMGMSRPWPEALAKVTGSRAMDGATVVDYFAPLKKWLDEQNRGKPVGW